MLAIFQREIKAFYNSPIAYVIMGVFILLTSLLGFSPVVQEGSAEITGIISMMNFVLILIVPLMTMRTLTEDRRNGTEVLLITSPVSITKIILGKYMALAAEFMALTGVSLLFPLLQFIFRNKDNMTIAPYLIGGYLGFILIGLAFYAIGIFFSALTENQIIAAIMTLLALALIFMMDYFSAAIGGVIGYALQWLSLYSRFQDFATGILSIAPIFYYLSIGTLFIFLTIRVIERRRWSQGR